MRITQILQEHAPHLLPRPKEPHEPDPELVTKHDRERTELLRVLGSFKKRKDAAVHLGLSTSGLYSRMHRLGIDYRSRGEAV